MISGGEADMFAPRILDPAMPQLGFVNTVIMMIMKLLIFMCTEERENCFQFIAPKTTN